MDFLATNNMEGRFQTFKRTTSESSERPKANVVGGNTGKKVSGNTNMEADLSPTQLGVLHQHYGSGGQQRGLSLSSSNKIGEIIGNTGESFRTDEGVRIKIDLAKVPEGDREPILLNHYSLGGIRNKIAEDSDIDEEEQGTNYGYEDSVTKNRELYLEYLKPEWIVGVEYHKEANKGPTEGENRELDINTIDSGNGGFMDQVKGMLSFDDYKTGMELGMSGSGTKLHNSAQEKGRIAGLEYKAGYDDGKALSEEESGFDSSEKIFKSFMIRVAIGIRKDSKKKLKN